MKKVTDKYIAAIISAVLVVYLILRTIFVPVVHDEAATFFHYIQPGKFIPFYAHWDANNHFLNSFGSWVCVFLLGKSAFALRLLNLLAFIPYLIASFKLSFKLTSKWLAWLCFVALLTCQFVLEFFALSRGYGLSMAFLMVAVYYLATYIETRIPVKLLFVAFFLSLGVWANLSLFNLSVVISLLVAYWFIKFNAWRSVQIGFYLKLVFFGIIPHVFALYYLLALKDRGLLYYGSLEGYFKVTLLSLAQFQFYTTNNTIVLGIVGLVLASLVLGLWNSVKNPTKPSAFISLAFILVGSSLFAWILATFLQVNYPEDRAAIYLIPLGILVFAFGLDTTQNVKLKYAGLVLLYFPIASIVKGNLSTSVLWPEQSLSNDFYQTIKQNDPKGTVCSYKLQQMDWAFYNLDQPQSVGPPQVLDYPSQIADWQIIRTDDFPTVAQNYALVKTDKALDQILIKRKQKVEFTAWKVVNPANTPADFSGEYFNIYEQLDSLWTETAMLSFTFKLTTTQQPFHGQFVISVDDSSGANIIYDFVPFNWLKSEWHRQEYSFKRYLANMPRNPKRVVVYLWNIDQTPYKLEQFQLRIDALTENSSFTQSN